MRTDAPRLRTALPLTLSVGRPPDGLLPNSKTKGARIGDRFGRFSSPRRLIPPGQMIGTVTRHRTTPRASAIAHKVQHRQEGADPTPRLGWGPRVGSRPACRHRMCVRPKHQPGRDRSSPDKSDGQQIGAGNGNRTHLLCLEGRCNRQNRLTRVKFWACTRGHSPKATNRGWKPQSITRAHHLAVARADPDQR